MSRAYRIEVSETLHRVIKAEDCVSTQLELLGLLPREQMQGLLAAELERRGFQQEDGVLVKRQGTIAITIDPVSGTVTASNEEECALERKRKKAGHAYNDTGPSRDDAERKLRDELQQELESEVEDCNQKLQQKVTETLEKALAGAREEIDQVVNRVTADALKIKAGQMGHIKSLSEDAETGSLTIVVEV